jgi:hypothetical protein
MVELLKDVVKQRESGSFHDLAWGQYHAVRNEPDDIRIMANRVVYFTEPGMRIFWRYLSDSGDDRQVLRDYQMALFNRVSVMTMSEENYRIAMSGSWNFLHVRG